LRKTRDIDTVGRTPHQGGLVSGADGTQAGGQPALE
jgi:hypothetical protein